MGFTYLEDLLTLEIWEESQNNIEKVLDSSTFWCVFEILESIWEKQMAKKRQKQRKLLNNLFQIK